MLRKVLLLVNLPREELFDLPETPEPEDAEQAVRRAFPAVAGDEVGQPLERNRGRHVHEEKRRQIPMHTYAHQQGCTTPLTSIGLIG